MKGLKWVFNKDVMVCVLINLDGEVRKVIKLNFILLFFIVLLEIFKCLVFIVSIWFGEFYSISDDLLCKVLMYIYFGSIMLSILCIKMYYVISVDLIGGFSIVFRIDVG